MKIVTTGAKWKGIPIGRVAIQQVFNYIKENQGLSRFDMSGDDNIRQALSELFEIGRKTGQMGVKIKYKLLKK